MLWYLFGIGFAVNDIPITCGLCSLNENRSWSMFDIFLNRRVINDFSLLKGIWFSTCPWRAKVDILCCSSILLKILWLMRWVPSYVKNIVEVLLSKISGDERDKMSTHTRTYFFPFVLLNDLNRRHDAKKCYNTYIINGTSVSSLSLVFEII